MARRSSRLAAVAWVAIVCAFQAACAGHAPPIQPRLASGFGRGAVAVRSIDVLPVDFSVTLAGREGPADAARAAQAERQAGVILRDAVIDGLARRGYRIAARLDWDGSAAGPAGARGLVLQPEELAELADLFVRFDEESGRAAPGLPLDGASVDPAAPSELGALTGGDATLYVGGWAHVAPSRSQAARVGRALAVGVFFAVIAAVAVVAVIAGGGKGGGGGLGRLGAGVAHGVGRAGAVVGRTALALGRGAGAVAQAVGEAIVRTPVDVALYLPPGHVHGPGCNAYLGVHDGYAYVARPRAPARIKSSAMALSLTLVDNRGGAVLWHVEQRFDAKATNDEAVRDALERILDTLPLASERAADR